MTFITPFAGFGATALPSSVVKLQTTPVLPSVLALSKGRFLKSGFIPTVIVSHNFNCHKCDLYLGPVILWAVTGRVKYYQYGRVQNPPVILVHM